MDACTVDTSRDLHVYGMLYNVAYRTRKEKGIGLEPGVVDSSTARASFEQSLAVLRPWKGVWYQECCINGIVCILYASKKYHADWSVVIIFEIDSGIADNEEAVACQYHEQVWVNPLARWYKEDMAVEHVRCIHSMLQVGQPVKDVLIEPPDATSLPVVILIHGYRQR